MVNSTLKRVNVINITLLVEWVRFDSKRIVSGAYDGKIKVWDLQAALDPRAPAGTLCLRTLVVFF